MTAPPLQDQPPVASRIAVVIVTRDQGPRLRRCLASLRDSFAVIVVDNGSNDTEGLESAFGHVRFIRLPRNFGLTKALNIGIRAAEADLVLLLSPEVEIAPAAVNALADVLDVHATVGAVCPLLLASDGSTALQTAELPSPSQPHPAPVAAQPGEQVRCVTAKAIMFRSFFLRALRHIDERYGDYGSSIELCRQVLRANKTILIHPTATGVIEPDSSPFSNAQEADREIGTARYLGKHWGFLAGAAYLVRRIFAALFSFHLGKLVALVSQKKIDGT